MSDLHKLIKKAARGESKAQRSLYVKYKSMWYMISMRYGKNKMQAEDILQEGMIKIFQDLGQFDESKGKFTTWSSRVLVNAALKFLKKSSWNDAFMDIGEVDEIYDDSVPAVNQITSKELTDMVRTLPMGYRLVFNMYAIEGYTHKEIGTYLGISIGTSKSQLSKARKHLRQSLESQLKISQT